MRRCARHLTIPSRTAAQARVRLRVGHWAAEAGLDAEAAHALALAVDEAVANAIEHGYAGRADGRVEVEATFRPDALVVVVRHRGVPLNQTTPRVGDPREAVARGEIHGYGLHLMRRLVDDLAFGLVGGTSEVRLTKRLT